MTARSARSADLSPLKSILLPSLVVTLGFQTLRVFFPGLVWYLGDTIGESSITQGLYAFATFLPAFLAAFLWKLAGPKRSLWLTAGGVALLRLVEQFVRHAPLDFALSLAGSALFLLFLPLFFGYARMHSDAPAAPRMAFGLALGLALDSAIRGASGTLDLSWIPGIGPVILVTLMAGLVLWSLWNETSPDTSSDSETTRTGAWTLLAIGPYLLLQALIFQNQGWIAEVTGLNAGAAFTVLMLGNVAAVLGLFWGFSRPQNFRGVMALIVAVYLGITGSTAGQAGRSFIITVILSQHLLGWSLAMLTTFASRGTRPGLGRTTGAVSTGMLLFLILAFVYYASLDIALPIPRTTIPVATAALVGVAVVLSSLGLRRSPLEPWTNVAPMFPAFVLFLVPLLSWALSRPPPASEQPTGTELKVMTYNIHSAYDTDGVQDPEAIARIIEQGSADIVALQEVSRGWLIDGSTDLVAWLSWRVDMQALFKGTTGPMWGNAILTRLPILDQGFGTLPLEGTILPRGYLWASLQAGASRPVLVIATHLHHIEAENHVRLVQIPVLLDFWKGEPYTLLMGDFNAEPHYPEIALISGAGLLDSWVEAGAGEGLTWPATAPYERIDWIWHTPDLPVTSAEIILSTASDHLPVLATFAIGSD